jgi:GntR family transcriptional repressor for pyruvate dehydrogenase complex
MAYQLKPIKPKRISDQVFDQLRELIFRGELKPGHQLMTERALAETLAVSRTTVRDAINKLVILGLLEHRQGQGTFVRSLEGRNGNPLAAVMETEDATLDDLLEVRMGLECNSASLAARRADERDIAFLSKNLNEMNVEIKSGRLGTEADTAFHMAIAFATKNPVQVSIMRNFYDLLFVGIKKSLTHLYESPASIAKILDQHRAIFESIREHDPDKAFLAMQNHIRFVQNFFREREEEPAK